MDCSIYSYNVIGEPNLFINKFSLEALGGLNKVYKASVENIISRIVHPDDQEIGLKAVNVVSKDHTQLFIHFRRFLFNETEYRWVFVVNGAIEITDTGDTKRILSYAKMLSSDFNEFYNCLQNLEFIGYRINNESLKTQLGSTFSDEVFEIIKIKDPEKRKLEFKRIENELRLKLHTPDIWDSNTFLNFFTAIQLNTKTLA